MDIAVNVLLKEIFKICIIYRQFGVIPKNTSKTFETTVTFHSQIIYKDLLTGIKNIAWTVELFEY